MIFIYVRDLIRNILKEARVQKKEKVELYKDDNVIVVVPLTHRALQKYASFCQWCINDDKSEWEYYHKGIHAVIIQRKPKKEKIGITGNPVASEILIMSRWDDGGYSFEDVCGILGYEFRNDRTLNDYYVNVSNDINNFATNIVYYSPENGIYDMEDNFLWNFNFEISDIPNMTPEIIRITDHYLWNVLNVPHNDSNNLKESEEWFKDIRFDEGGIDDEVMNYLKDNYNKVSSYMGDYIVIDEKPFYLNFNSKKRTVGKIYLEIVDQFKNVTESILRRTIRTYINSLI
jgi:hypothetical protein